MEALPRHGGQLREVAARFGVAAAELLDFSANLNPEGPPEGVLPALRSALESGAALTRYPDLAEGELRERLAEYAGVRAGNVTVANGFVPLLEAVVRELDLRSCVVPVPSFVEYRRTLQRLRVEVLPLPLAPDLNFSYEAVDLFDRGSHAILLANPQNPSGCLASREAVLRMAREAARRNAFVLMDEAFIDYCPEESTVCDVERLPNLIVFRSVTKFFGMAGMRVAYVATNRRLAGRLQEVIAPWAITTLASVAASAAVRDETYRIRTVAQNETRRRQLKLGLEKLGLHVYPSAANFLLLRSAASATGEGWWEEMIRKHGIVLRNCANYEGLDGGYLRAAILREAENERLVAALGCVVGAVV